MSDIAPSAAPEPARVDEDAIRQRVREARAALALAAHEQALRAIEGTPGGADTRARRQVPADRAGEHYVTVDNHCIAHCETTGQLSWRQCRAAEHMAFLYRIGGRRRPFVRSYGGESDVDPGAVAAARQEYDTLMAGLSAQEQSVIEDICRDSWPHRAYPLPELRSGLTVIADRLRYST